MLRVQEYVFAESFLWISSWSKIVVRFVSNSVAGEAGHPVTN